jgi:hypothetical protein
VALGPEGPGGVLGSTSRSPEGESREDAVLSAVAVASGCELQAGRDGGVRSRRHAPPSQEPIRLESMTPRVDSPAGDTTHSHNDPEKPAITSGYGIAPGRGGHRLGARGRTIRFLDGRKERSACRSLDPVSSLPWRPRSRPRAGEESRRARHSESPPRSPGASDRGSSGSARPGPGRWSRPGGPGVASQSVRRPPACSSLHEHRARCTVPSMVLPPVGDC